MEILKSFAAPLIFIFIFILQAITRFLQMLKKRGLRNTTQFRLRQEIKQLLKEANSLSTPSTFAQSAKLKRLAAAKEKELAKMQGLENNQQKGSFDLFLTVIRVLQVVTYLFLSWWFWGAPIAAVPKQLLQPFIGNLLSWKAGESTEAHVMIGIVPWLILTNRVSKHVCQKLPMLK